ncbi:SusC/RagA family TonB-linked outer membrane protein [Flagellimonas aequoris]|uniref:SusC/RagA family TonB-linked outer membrane protein n=1 Tax=Flagellimonas aequoris TaxID=2306997 RepID=A0A418N9C3_9FLAO|nr:SusC/RagA family TonB-linked outer membrane protein [Allomuricauda aequoris]RIV72015.1 SusC/RagA family TonB-linked outer membrane protein [Allomuricauda aequoris]TXK03784.1 SusC/RagA family TonB-linked outer membrane protein [Allomuricauda aequoris]
MRTKLNGLLTLLLAFVVHISFAQDKTITGTVTDADGLPLPGVNIVVEGTSNGTQTDFDGNYSISASQGQTLLFTYIGQKPATRVVGAGSVVNVQMVEDTQALEEVVVTAQGIKREKKALGYAVSSVGADQLEQKTEGDVGRILSGKASGVNITQQSGLSGSATNIVIRGYQSFSQNNQPLFIVDGVPFSSDTNAQGDFEDGNNGSSRFLDLDPNSIAEVNVLKGLSAATLYGEAGKNGVILITTKNGAAGGKPKKSEITVTSSLFFNQIASMPEYTMKYGNGFDQAFGWFFSNWGPSFEKEGRAGWGNAANFPGTYDLQSDGTILHPYSTAGSATGIPAAFPEYQGRRYAWKPYDSVGEFFKTGTVANLSINAGGSSDDGKVSYNATFGHLEDQGFTRGNSLNRNTIGIGGRAMLSNKFTVSGTMNYSRTDFKSPPVALGDGNQVVGNGSSVFSNIFFTPRSVDLMGLPYENPITGGSVYYRQNNSIQHPLWTVAHAKTRQLTNRAFGNMSLQYDITENLNILYRFGYDIYNERNTEAQDKGGVGVSTQYISGIYGTWDNNNTIWDHSLILTGNYDLTEKLDMTFNVGGTTRSTNYDRQGVFSSGQNVFGVLRHFNFDLQNEIQYTSYKNIVGLYGQVDFGYNNFLYLTLNGRNDWVSNQSVDNRSLFYKGASFSFVPTSAIDGLQSQGGVNFLKLRGGYGESAGFAEGFPTSVNLSINTQDFINDDGGYVVTNSVSNTVANPNIKPEKYSEIEVGVEGRFFNFVNLDLSAYQRITKDLIINRPLDPSTGGTLIQTNVGEIKGKGLEIDLGFDLIRGDNLNWSVNTNFNTGYSEVTDLGADTDLIVYSGYSNLGNAAIEGERLGVIVGSRVARDENGNFLTDSSGNYISEEVDENDRLPVIGDPNPDFILNVNNTFSYKGFNFNFLFNYVHGGDIYSQTVATLLGRGLIADTDDRETSFVLPGYNTSGEPNNVQINNSAYYFSNVLFGPAEMNIYDATTLRLQEVSLGYSVPKKFLDKTPFGSLSFTVSGFNLWYEAFNTPKSANFDPNVAGLGVGNGRGFDWLNGPSSKRYGVSVKATF